MKKPLVLIAGPTAVGKTSLGVAVAQRVNGEIVSADSMQIYSELSIGTAKPTLEEMGGVRHHMINVASMHTAYTVGDYVRSANLAIEDIRARGKTPILVGGTGMYMKALLYGYALGGAPSDKSIRLKYLAIQEERGGAALHAMLAQRDPKRALQLHEHDTVRVIRALELLDTVGSTEGKSTPAIPHQLYVLDGERAQLYARIESRVDTMIARGLLDEVQNLLAQGANRGCQAMQAIGYKEIIGYLDGQMSLEKTIFFLKQNTRHYAKRQLTFFRHLSEPKWLNFSATIDENCDTIIEKFGNLL